MLQKLLAMLAAMGLEASKIKIDEAIQRLIDRVKEQDKPEK